MIYSDQSTDLELLQGITQGVALALSCLYDRYAPRLFGLILQIIKNRSDAEDVLQETMLQVWQQAGRFDSNKARPEVWLLMLARSRAIDRLRKSSVRNLPDSKAIPLQVSAERPAGEMAMQKEDRQQVCTALCMLSTEQQEPIRLSFYEGLTHMEIAHQLQLPLGTVKTRIRSGMQQLRSSLTAFGEIER